MNNQYQQPHKESHKVRNTFLGIGIGIVAIIVISVAASGGNGTGSTDASSTTTGTSATTTAEPVATPSPSAPSMTTGEQQAVDSAENYLSMGSGFSYSGLLNQLTSSAGDGDTQSDAKFAINYLHPDWDAQAVESAKNYLQLGGFSRESLIQQLTSSAGGGYTEGQAEYAAAKVGL